MAKQINFLIDHDEKLGRWYVTDKTGTLYGNLSGFKSEELAFDWINQDKATPRYRCQQCKRIWTGTPTWTGKATCPICEDTNAVLKQMVKE